MPLVGCRLLAILLLALAGSPAWAHSLRGPESRIDHAEASLEAAGPVAATGRSPDSPVQLQFISGPASLTRSGVGVPEVASVLSVMVGLVGVGRSWRRNRRTAITTATAALVLGFVLETTPHLVHHALDADKGAGCQVLQAAERSPVAVGALDVTPAPALARVVDLPSVANAPTLAAPAPRGRAPPA